MYGGPGGQNLFGGGGAGGPPPGMGGPPPGMSGYGGNRPQETSESKVTSLNVPISDLHLPKYAGMRFAEDVLPERMAIISGSFPYKKQLEEYVNKLQYATLTDLFKDPRDAPTFLGIDVQRREVNPDGKPILGPDGKPLPWQKIDLEKALKRLVLVTGRRLEAEDPKYTSLDFFGLVWRRPIQFEGKKYPTPEDELPGLSKTLASIKAANPEFKPKNPFDPKDLDVYDLGGPVTNAGGMGGMSGGGPGDGGSSPTMPPSSGPGTGDGGMNLGQQQLQQIPEYCLVRFIDVTVEPGKNYNYQMRVRMKNPNYGRDKEVAWASLAADKEIKSDWVLVKDDSDPNRPIEEQARVSVGSEAAIYAVDQAVLDSKSYTGSRTPPQHDQTVVQIHRWMDFVRPDPNEQRISYPVGDWVIGERLLINRGEYLTRTDKVEVPIWLIHDEKFGVMQYKKDKKVPVTFNMDQGQGDLLLVDFQRGDLMHRKLVDFYEEKNIAGQPKYDTVKDKEPTELMFLTPSGKLSVHSSEMDPAEEQARKDRLHAVKERMKTIKEGGSGSKPMDNNPFGSP